MELTYLNGTPSQRADFDTAFGLVQLHYPPAPARPLWPRASK